MTKRNRIVRLGCALALAGALATQLTGGLTTAAFAQSEYLGQGKSPNFLGIRGVSSQNVLQGSVAVLVAYGIISSAKSDSDESDKPAPAPAPQQPAPADPSTGGAAQPAPPPAAPNTGGN